MLNNNNIVCWRTTLATHCRLQPPVTARLWKEAVLPQFKVLYHPNALIEGPQNSSVNAGRLTKIWIRDIPITKDSTNQSIAMLCGYDDSTGLSRCHNTPQFTAVPGSIFWNLTIMTGYWAEERRKCYPRVSCAGLRAWLKPFQTMQRNLPLRACWTQKHTHKVRIPYKSSNCTTSPIHLLYIRL